MTELDYIEISKICENIVKKIFEELPSFKLKVEKTIERTDSGALLTTEIKFKKREK